VPAVVLVEGVVHFDEELQPGSPEDAGKLGVHGERRASLPGSFRGAEANEGDRAVTGFPGRMRGAPGSMRKWTASRSWDRRSSSARDEHVGPRSTYNPGVDRSALELLCREEDLLLVVLFGSRARGIERADSDTDVGVLRREGLVPSERFLSLAGRLTGVLGMSDVDLVDLRRASGLLQHQVGTHGRALFEDEPGRFNLFRVHAWKLYLDEMYLCRRHDKRFVRETLDRLRA